MEDLNNQNNNNESQNNSEEVNNNDIIQDNNKNEEKNTANTANTAETEKNGQTPQNENIQSNNNTSNVNFNAKKKSKAPIIIIVVLIVVLIFGCLTIGGVFLVFGMFKNYNKNETINKIENITKEINTTNTNSSRNNSSRNTNKNSTTNNTASNNTTNNTTATNSTVQSNSSTITDAKVSTKENPLEKGTWGIASKYSTESKEYEDVYIKVTNIVRGEEAKKAVQDYINGKSYYKYEEPKEGLEWVVLDYDLDFANFKKTSFGANADVTASIRGIGDHNSVVYNGTTYILSSRYIGSSDYVKTQTTTGKIAFQMPIGCKDYIVQFGSYNNTNAYFKGE